MDRLGAMSLLLVVVEAGSLSAGARRLDRPLSTVSRRISELESHLGVRLLVRSGRRLELTKAGTGYVAAARRILDDVSEAERTAAGEYARAQGELVITAPVVFGRRHVLPVLASFLAAHPDVDVRLVQADRVLHLADEYIDVAVRVGALPDSALVASRLGEVRRIVCASPGYLAAHGTPATPAALAAHGCVTFDNLDRGGTWTFGHGNDRHRIAVRSRLVVNTAEAAIDAALAGIGPTRILSYQVAEALQDGRLEILLAASEPAPLPVSLVHGPRGPVPLKVRAFLDFARPRLARVLKLPRSTREAVAAPRR